MNEPRRTIGDKVEALLAQTNWFEILFAIFFVSFVVIGLLIANYHGPR